MTFFPIAEYRPDVAELNTGYTDEMSNVLLSLDSCIPAPSLSSFGEELPDEPHGVFCTRSDRHGVFVFVGTSNDLYLFDNANLSWTNVSKTMGGYNANYDSRWSFAPFGNYVIAVNKNNPPQVYELGVSNRFRDLGGNPPYAGLVKIWGDFVCLMQLSDQPNRVQWSGINNAEWWTPGQNNSDYQDFPDGGIVQGSSEATNPIVFLQSAIYKATFVPGSDIVFSFQKIHDKRGAKSPRSIACRGNYAFYVDEGGFFQISTDGGIASIGFEKVDRTVFSQLNANNASNIFGAIDPFYSRIYWAIDYEGEGKFTEMFIYDWELQRWTRFSGLAFITLFPLLYSHGYTLEGLDRVSVHIEELPFSLDSKAWQGGAPILGVITSGKQIGSFSGEPMEAIVTSQETGSTSGYVRRIETVYPVVDTDEALIEVGGRMRRNQREPLRWSEERQSSFNTGRYHIRSRARFHKFRLRIPAGETWSYIKGFDVTFNSAGRR